MPTFEVTVGVFSTATAEVDASDEDEAREMVNELLGNGELEFEEDGSYEMEVVEL